MSEQETTIIKKINLTTAEINKLNKFIDKMLGRRFAATEIGVTQQTLGSVIRNGYCNSETLAKIKAKIN